MAIESAEFGQTESKESNEFEFTPTNQQYFPKKLWIYVPKPSPLQEVIDSNIDTFALQSGYAV